MDVPGALADLDAAAGGPAEADRDKFRAVSLATARDAQFRDGPRAVALATRAAAQAEVGDFPGAIAAAEAAPAGPLAPVEWQFTVTPEFRAMIGF